MGKSTKNVGMSTAMFDSSSGSYFMILNRFWEWWCFPDCHRLPAHSRQEQRRLMRILYQVWIWLSAGLRTLLHRGKLIQVFFILFSTYIIVPRKQKLCMMYLWTHGLLLATIYIHVRQSNLYLSSRYIYIYDYMTICVYMQIKIYGKHGQLESPTTK